MDCLPALLLLTVCSLASGAWIDAGALIGDARALPLNDFESGAMSPWFDESAADAKWYLESFDAPFDPSVPVPQPGAGSKYLRVQRPPGTSGQAALRSELFTAQPGDELRFSFWIRSQILQTNNLEVYWQNGTRLERILSLVQYSTPTNFEWREASVVLPVTAPTETRLSIFGFCNSGDVDGIAIDNLAVVASGQTLPPATSTTPGIDATSTTTTTTQSPGGCPSNLGSNDVHCVTLAGKCYCISSYTVDSWYTAESYCKSNSANLLSLETSGETSAINSYLGSLSLDMPAFWSSGQWSGSAYVWTGSNQPFTSTHRHFQEEDSPRSKVSAASDSRRYSNCR